MCVCACVRVCVCVCVCVFSLCIIITDMCDIECVCSLVYLYPVCQCMSAYLVVCDYNNLFIQIMFQTERERKNVCRSIIIVCVCVCVCPHYVTLLVTPWSSDCTYTHSHIPPCLGLSEGGLMPADGDA